MALDVFYVSSSFHPVSSCTLRFTEALEVHDLARPQELDDVVDVGIVGKAQDVIVGHARLLLCGEVLGEVGDGIARASGLEKCMMNELLEFPNGEYGIAQNLEEANCGNTPVVWSTK